MRARAVAKKFPAILQLAMEADDTGAPNENIVQNHLNIELLNVF